jgi:proline iminopeptidase
VKKISFISKRFPRILNLLLPLVFLVFTAKTFSQKTILSPQPPSPSLSTSLPPQQTSLPTAPFGLPLKQGYFQGKDGVQLFYRVVGKGKDTIVFIHGGPGAGMEDGGLDLELIAAKGYTFIEYDQRGGARSELVRDTTKLTVNDHIIDLEALRQYFKLQKLSLIGLSWGCRVVAEYNNRFPQQVKRLVFLSPGPIKSGGLRRAAADSALGQAKRKQLDEMNKLMDTVSDKDLPSFWGEFLSIAGSIYVTDSTHLSRARGSEGNYSPLAIRNRKMHPFRRYYGDPPWDLRYLLHNIKAPAIVIEGAKSVVPLADTRLWVDNIKGAELILIPNAGHLNWLDQPEAVRNVLDKFFKATRKD